MNVIECLLRTRDHRFRTFYAKDRASRSKCKRPYEPQKSKRSPPPMDTRYHKVVPSALLATSIGIGYLRRLEWADGGRRGDGLGNGVIEEEWDTESRNSGSALEAVKRKGALDDGAPGDSADRAHAAAAPRSPATALLPGRRLTPAKAGRSGFQFFFFNAFTCTFCTNKALVIVGI
ncbi:hypothetical protein EVAR_26628_1 [Eumeta japonica]|uniref:Uncharacterized protein n=1 Tax=Eumeta variegata TaxID=151549 RepID=A0A4C1XLC8_EUMVA|nr:hypothetical protein EVAR_26628_1 [Eumeta japonica]